MFIKTVEYLETKFDTYYDMYEFLTNYFVSSKLIERRISYDEIYETLYKLFKDDVILKQVLTYDYYTNFKGTRDFMYVNNEYDIKKEIPFFIKDNKTFENMTLPNVLKSYKFLILDYNIDSQENVKTIYFFNK